MAFKFVFSSFKFEPLEKIIWRRYFIFDFVICKVNNRRTKHQSNCLKIHPENLHDPSNIICYTGWMKKKKEKKKQSKKQISTYLKVLSSVEVLYLIIIVL